MNRAFYVIQTKIKKEDETKITSLFTFKEAVLHGWIDSNGNLTESKCPFFEMSVSINGFNDYQEAVDFFEKNKSR